MAQISNQAQLTYTFGTNTARAASNIAVTNLIGPLGGSKKSLADTYRNGDTITYILAVNNISGSELTNVRIVDNLGTFAHSGGFVTPLTFAGNAKLYLNGIYSAPITPVIGADNITFTIPSISGGKSAIIVYDALVNSYAPLATGSSITNTATVSAADITDFLILTNTISAESYADVTITKNMSPNPVTSGDMLTYTFTLYNYGNVAASSVIFSDTFDPIPADIVVAVNGLVLSADSYIYTAGGLLTIPDTTSSYSLTVPAATYATGDDGVVTTVPGTLHITVQGNITG